MEASGNDRVADRGAATSVGLVTAVSAEFRSISGVSFEPQTLAFAVHHSSLSLATDLD